MQNHLWLYTAFQVGYDGRSHGLLPPHQDGLHLEAGRQGTVDVFCIGRVILGMEFTIDGVKVDG